MKILRLKITIGLISMIVLMLIGCQNRRNDAYGLHSNKKVIPPDTTSYLIVEGKGIKSVGFLGEKIEKVLDVWGKPDVIAKDDFPFSTDTFYEYHKRGVEFTVEYDIRIRQIHIFCKTRDTSRYHTNGLMWRNPSSFYSTFRGITSKGLKLHSNLSPNDVYKIYGEPIIQDIGGNSNFDSLASTNQSFIFNEGAAGFDIIYPKIGIRFNTFNNFVESISLSIKD